jgi:hypothetical protein
MAIVSVPIQHHLSNPANFSTKAFSTQAILPWPVVQLSPSLLNLNSPPTADPLDVVSHSQDHDLVQNTSSSHTQSRDVLSGGSTLLATDTTIKGKRRTSTGKARSIKSISSSTGRNDLASVRHTSEPWGHVTMYARDMSLGQTFGTKYGAWDTKAHTRSADENLVDCVNQYNKHQGSLPVEEQKPLSTGKCLFQRFLTNNFTISQTLAQQILY